MISAIVAVDNNWGIGYKGDLLISIPQDLKRFKSLTTGNIVIMGSKTWDSLPKKPLPNRINMVIDFDKKNEYYFSMEEVKNKLLQEKDSEFFIIGGGSIYEQLLSYCDRVYVTKIYKSFDNVDTYFPNLNNSDWICAPVGDIMSYQDVEYQYWIYDKI